MRWEVGTGEVRLNSFVDKDALPSSITAGLLRERYEFSSFYVSQEVEICDATLWMTDVVIDQ